LNFPARQTQGVLAEANTEPRGPKLLTPASVYLEYVPFITIAGQAVHLVDQLLAGGHSHGDLYREAVFGKIVYEFALPGSPQHLWYAAIAQKLMERGTYEHISMFSEMTKKLT
jgi:hypothetical protein